MIKFDMELDLSAEELAQGVEKSLNAATGKTASDLTGKMQDIAASKLKSGLKHWESGLSMERVPGTQETYVITMTGKLANMIEDGFSGEELKHMLLNGNRAKQNVAQQRKDGKPAKPYVDVPKTIMDAEGAAGVKKLEMQFSDVMNANDMIQRLGRKDVKISDWVKGGVRTEQRVISRAKDMILSKQAETGAGMKASIMQIRRIGEDTKIDSYAGAKVFDSNELDAFIKDQFELNLRKMI